MEWPGEQFGHLLKHLFNAEDQKQKRHIEIMSALENLTAAITGLQTSVDAAVTTINTPHPTDAQVQAATTAISSATSTINAEMAKIKAAVPTAP